MKVLDWVGSQIDMDHRVRCKRWVYPHYELKGLFFNWEQGKKYGLQVPLWAIGFLKNWEQGKNYGLQVEYQVTKH